MCLSLPDGSEGTRRASIVNISIVRRNQPRGRSMRTLFTAIVGSCLLSGCGFPLLTCPSSATLESLATCVRDQMPQSGSNGYVIPTSEQRGDWKSVVRQMLKGSCDFALPSSLDEVVQMRTFNDTSNGRSYCLLMEVGDRNRNNVVDSGFGTFIVFN